MLCDEPRLPFPHAVMPGLVPGIHVFNVARRAIVGGRERLRSN
jgi:hypothetical protein